MLKDENEQLRAELAEARAVNREMRANICARYEAWDELVTLYRERQLELARRTERTLETTLH
ncbi:MAG TPA: hypothetical protein VKE42_00590 [Candidatus Cybelea sp.]|nr:hypothetical protein [Candidatus Cybelea sp.]